LTHRFHRPFNPGREAAMLSDSATLRLVLALSALGLGGCSSVYLEYDRMTGTSYPPAQTVDGKQVTLASIYASEGYWLRVQEDQTGIAALTGPANPSDPNQYDYITEAELDTVEQANRSIPVAPSSYVCFDRGFFPMWCVTYHLYGIVVNHFYEDNDGVRSQGTMGIMWASTNRRAFANFYRNTTVNSDGAKFLRSTAHEIGHAYDLHHGDGDGSTDIMNQTGVVGNNYVFRFVAAASKNHLKDHDKQCVWPGLGPFGAVHTGHSDHGITTAKCP
jgi:hypothetical protein